MNKPGSKQTHNAQPKFRGEVVLGKQNEIFNGMDMKVHLKLKNPGKKSRSRSLPKSEPSKFNAFKSNVPDGAHHRKCWSEVLKETASAHETKQKSHVHSNNKRCRSSSTERPVRDKDKPVHASQSTRDLTDKENYLGTKDLEYLYTFSLFNPVRTLQFLFNELHTIVQPKGERLENIFSLAEQLITQLPQESPVRTAKSESSDPAPGHPHHGLKYELRRTTFEAMRKERDNLTRDLEEKSNSHLQLERRVALLEAKLTRARSEREKYRLELEKLLETQKSWARSLQSQRANGVDVDGSRALRRELDAAYEFINQLQTATVETETRFRSKMQLIDSVLNDCLDSSRNDSLRINDMVGLPPDEDTQNVQKHSVHESEPRSQKWHEARAASKPAHLQPPPDTLRTNFNIDNLSKYSADRREEYAFYRLPELPVDSMFESPRSDVNVGARK